MNTLDYRVYITSHTQTLIANWCKLLYSTLINWTSKTVILQGVMMKMSYTKIILYLIINLLGFDILDKLRDGNSSSNLLILNEYCIMKNALNAINDI